MTDASHVSPTYAGEPPQPCDDFPACVSFDAHGLVPVVVQQEGTGEVLMVAWANREALDLTIKTRTSWFWSRSRKDTEPSVTRRSTPLLRASGQRSFTAFIRNTPFSCAVPSTPR